MSATEHMDDESETGPMSSPTIPLTRREMLRQTAFAVGIAGLAGLWTPFSERPAFAAPASGAAAGPTRWALLVGVGDYARTDVNWLRGPLNDIPAMRELLTEKYGFAPDHMKVLLNKEASRKNILDSWEWLIDGARPGDQVLFYFSGHGTRVKERVPGTHPGGYDSALCPFDAMTPRDLIPGSDVGERIDRLKTDHVVVIVDACHSGFASRAPTITPRFIPTRLFGQPTPPRKGASDGRDTRDGETAFSDLTRDSEKDAAKPSFVLTRDDAAGKRTHKEKCLGAARIDQSACDDAFLPVNTSLTSRDANPKMGALTYFLLKELRADTNNSLTYAEVTTRVRGALRERYGASAQEPQLSGPDVESSRFLSLTARDATPVTTPPVTGTTSTLPTVTEAPRLPNIAAEVVKVDGKTIALRGIAGATLVPGSMFATVVPTGAGTAASKKWELVEDPVSLEGRALVKLTSAVGSTGAGVLLSGGAKVGDRLTEAFRGTPEGPLRISLKGPTMKQVREAIADLVKTGVVQVVSDSVARLGGSEAALFADSTEKITIFRGAMALPPLPIAEVVDQLRRLWAVKTLYDLKNSAPNLRVSISVNGQEGFADVAIKEKITYTITASDNCFLTILDLTADGKVEGKRSFAVEAGRTLSDTAIVEPPIGIDVLKVFATKNPLSVNIPENAAQYAEMGNDSVKIARSVLGELRRAINNESQRGADLKKWELVDDGVATDGWSSAEIFLRIRS